MKHKSKSEWTRVTLWCCLRLCELICHLFQTQLFGLILINCVVEDHETHKRVQKEDVSLVSRSVLVHIHRTRSDRLLWTKEIERSVQNYSLVSEKELSMGHSPSRTSRWLLSLWYHWQSPHWYCYCPQFYTVSLRWRFLPE